MEIISDENKAALQKQAGLKIANLLSPTIFWFFPWNLRSVVMFAAVLLRALLLPLGVAEIEGIKRQGQLTEDKFFFSYHNF